MNTDHYLARLGYGGATTPTIETLRALHRAHLFAVPFENLDIGRGRPIVLDEAALYDKIVARRRGGFCYELNGLFALLLRALGFQVTLLAAGVYNDQRGSCGPTFDHLTLRVDLERPWLADVGFGDLFLYPLPLDTEEEQIDSGRAEPLLAETSEGVWQDRFRIATDGDARVLQRRDRAGAWRDQYRFALTPRQWTDFDAQCHYHQTSPESGFTRGSVCSLATPSGRVSVTGDRLIVTEGAAKRETALADESARRAALQEYCGITL